MLRVIVVLAFILHVSVAMADEPLEIRSRILDLQDDEGVFAGIMQVEFNNRGPNILTQIVMRPTGLVWVRFDEQVITVDQLQPGMVRNIMIPVKVPKMTVDMASSCLNWLAKYSSVGERFSSSTVIRLNIVEPFIESDGGLQ